MPHVRLGRRFRLGARRLWGLGGSAIPTTAPVRASGDSEDHAGVDVLASNPATQVRRVEDHKHRKDQRRSHQPDEQRYDLGTHGISHRHAATIPLEAPHLAAEGRSHVRSVPTAQDGKTPAPGHAWRYLTPLAAHAGGAARVADASDYRALAAEELEVGPGR